MDDGWWLAISGWWLVVGGWWMLDGGWWLDSQIVIKKQRNNKMAQAIVIVMVEVMPTVLVKSRATVIGQVMDKVMERLLQNSGKRKGKSNVHNADKNYDRRDGRGDGEYMVNETNSDSKKRG